jgi:hypothetical protein
MRVKMKIGKNAGEILDLSYGAAINLVLADQAEDVDGQMRLAPAPPKVTRIDATTIEGSEPAGEVVTVVTAEPHNVPIAETPRKKFKPFRR